MNKRHTTKFLIPFLAIILLGGWLGARQDTGNLIRVTIDPGRKFQQVDGFGVNFNGSYFRESQKPMIDMLIDDLGATIFRLDAYGSDLSNWETVNDNDDPKVMNWDFYNDRYSTPNFEASWAASRYIVSRGGKILLAAIGIVPEWMLDDKAPAPRHKVCSNSTKPGRPDHLNAAMYEEYAEQMVSMAMYARSQAHVSFEYFSPFNETDCYPSEGPRIDPEEAPRVLEALARRLKGEGLGDIRIVGVEQANVTTDYISPILGNPGLMRQIGAFAFHTYGDASVGPQVERVSRSLFPDTHVWLTEYGDLNDRDKSFENEWKNQSLKSMQRALRALNQGATAALFWDAFDNFEMCEMRPSFYGLMRNDNHFYSPKKRYYAARQLYRFVRPGFERIEATSDSPGLMLSAFRGGSVDSVVIVGVKQGAPQRVEISMPGSEWSATSWELYETTRTRDCSRVGPVVVSGEKVRIDLPEEAVFTLIGSTAKTERRP